MKKVIYLICLLALPYLVSAQSWISSTRINSTASLIEISSAIDDEGNVISFGYFQGELSSSNGLSIISNGGIDYFVIKFRQNGEVDWMHNFGGDLSEWGTGGIGTDSNGDIFVTGGFQGILKYSETDSIESIGNNDIFFTKIDNQGNIIWFRNAGKGSQRIFPTALTIEESGNILITGSFRDSINVYDTVTLFSDNSVPDFFYAQFEPNNGDLNWIKQARSLNQKSGNIWNIISTFDGYYFTGIFSDSIGFDNDTLIHEMGDFSVFIFKTDLFGNITWNRKITGNKREYCYSIAIDDVDNIYLGGYFTSDTLIIDISEFQITQEYGNRGSNDIFIIQYSSSGEMNWFKKLGGTGDDRIFNLEFFDDKIYISGTFADTLRWGGIALKTKGISDNDMFTGALDKTGNYREANSYSGRNNSTEEARALFKNGDQLYTVMRTNSDLLVLGDSIYTSDGITYYMVLGVIGCLPISIDNVLVNDVNTCYGDSTGSLQIMATGGFGSPYQYSIDNGLSYQSNAYFQELPAGDYPVVVIDQENCAQEGPLVSVGQPDTLRIELVSSADITNEADGSIVVAATGGTTPYTFTLLPDNLIQGFGTYTFQPGDSGRYVVQVNDAKNCGPVKTDSIDIMDFYGVGFEDISGLEVRMFPNPASNMITLEMPLDEAEVTLEVMSLTGQVMISRQVYPSGGVLRETIDVSDLSKGMYMLRVNGKTMRSGIVVN